MYMSKEYEVPLGPTLEKRMLNQFKVNHCEPVGHRKRAVKQMKAERVVAPVEFKCPRCIAVNSARCHHWWLKPKKGSKELRDE
jgi:hypothetical protein